MITWIVISIVCALMAAGITLEVRGYSVLSSFVEAGAFLLMAAVMSYADSVGQKAGHPAQPVAQIFFACFACLTIAIGLFTIPRELSRLESR